MYGFDDSRRPLYFTRLAGRLSIADIEAMERDIIPALERRTSYAWVLDLTELEFPPREVIAAGLKMSRRVSEVFADIYLHPADAPAHYTGYAMSSRITRLIEFFHSISPRNTTKPVVFADVEAAMAAAEAVLEQRGLRVPPRAQRVG